MSRTLVVMKAKRWG